MIVNDDTLSLLKECNSGIQMAVYSMDEVLDEIKDPKFKTILKDSVDAHKKLGDESHMLLVECGEEKKDPGLMAKGMSWIKTNAKLMMDDSDKKSADLITEGCNMGIKTLYRYMNEYKTADDKVRQLAENVIREEETLRHELRCYL